MDRSERSGAYIFKEDFIDTERTKEFFEKKQLLRYNHIAKFYERISQKGILFYLYISYTSLHILQVTSDFAGDIDEPQ